MDRNFDRIVDTYSHLLLKICMHYVKNISDAEDIIQQTFLKIIEKDVHFESTEHEKVWLIRVCTNLCKDSLKTVTTARHSHLKPTAIQPTATLKIFMFWTRYALCHP